MKQRIAILPAVDEVTRSPVGSVSTSPAGKGSVPCWLAGLVLVVACFGAASAVAQEDPCLGLIEASRLVAAEFSDSESFQTHANNFCNEYSQERSRNRSFRGSGSFDFLGAALNLKQATANEIATRFCSADDFSRADSDVFAKYTEMISPEAYEAYGICRRTLERDGARVKPYVSQDKKRVNFSISDPRREPEKFEGIDSDIFECRDGDKTIDRKGVNGEAVSLSSDALNVVCERLSVTCTAGTPDERCPTLLPEVPSSYQLYSAGHLTLNLSSGQENIEFKRFEDGPTIRELRELEGQVAGLRGVLEAHSDDLADMSSFRESHAHVSLSEMRWHDVKRERVNAGRFEETGTNRYSTRLFRNDRDYQIVVSVTTEGDSGYCGVDFEVDGQFFAGPIGGHSRFTRCHMSMLVPPRASYKVFYKKTVFGWWEFFASDGSER